MCPFLLNSNINANFINQRMEFPVLWPSFGWTATNEQFEYVWQRHTVDLTRSYLFSQASVHGTKLLPVTEVSFTAHDTFWIILVTWNVSGESMCRLIIKWYLPS